MTHQTNENDPAKLDVGIEQPRTGPVTEGGDAEEGYDTADVEERLATEPEEARNLTDPAHEQDQSTGDA